MSGLSGVKRFSSGTAKNKKRKINLKVICLQQETKNIMEIHSDTTENMHIKAVSPLVSEMNR